jgi:hypothetical protein
MILFEVVQKFSIAYVVNDPACTVHVVLMAWNAKLKIRISTRIRIYLFEKALAP